MFDIPCKALYCPMPERTTMSGPVSSQNAALEHDGTEGGSANTIQHQGPLLLLCLSSGQSNGLVIEFIYVWDP